MAVATTSLIRRRLRQRFGISAPKVAIRAQVPWPWRILSIIGFLALSVLLAAWMYDTGRRLAGFHSQESGREIAELQHRLADMESELVSVRQASVAGESGVQIERAAKEQLLRKVAQLEQENASLKEDVAFFETIVPSAESAEDGLRISRLRVEPEVRPGSYRYRLLVALESGRQTREFKGNLQFHLKVRQGGKDAMIVVPAEGEADVARFRLEIKRFLRVEGGFSTPVDGVLKSVEARLIQDGVVRARQSLNL